MENTSGVWLFFTQWKHYIASMKIWNKLSQNLYEAACQTVETKIISPTLEKLKGETKRQKLYVRKEWKGPTQFHWDSWCLETGPSSDTFNFKWYKTESLQAPTLEKLKPALCLAFLPDKRLKNQLPQSLLIHFLPVDQLCGHLSPCREHVWWRSGHSLRVKHHFLKHTPMSRPRGQFELRVTERPRQHVTHWWQPRSAFHQNDQRFMASLSGLLLNCRSMAERDTFMSTQQPCRWQSVHQAQWRGGVTCLCQGLMTGF